MKKKIYFVGIKNLKKYFEEKYEVLEIEIKHLIQLQRNREDFLMVINLKDLNYTMEEREILSKIPTILIADTLDESNLYLGYSLGIEDIVDERVGVFFLKKKIEKVFERFELLAEIKKYREELIRWGENQS